MMPTPTIYPDRESWITGVADFITDLAVKAIAEHGRFTFAFSGGNTPRPVYARLASAGYSDRIDWSRVQVFSGDERCVPPDDPMTNIHRIHGEDPPEQAAADYAGELQNTFGGDARARWLGESSAATGEQGG